MSKTTAKTKANNIRTATGRDKLVKRNEPYWLKLGLGQAIGFRKPVTGAPSWKARLHLRNEYRHSTFPGTLEFAEALELAQEFFATAAQSPGATIKTVSDAARRYAKLKPDTVSWHQRLIHSDPIGGMAPDKLTPDDVSDWVERHHTDVVGTMNRRKTVLIAVLRHAMKMRAVASNWAWADELKRVKETARRRPITEAELQALRPHLGPLGPLVEFLAVVPLRVGAALALEAGDLQGDHLTIRIDKANAGRVITLGGRALDLARQACKDKLPRAKMFDGVWTQPAAQFAEIVAKALPPGAKGEVVLYGLRHMAITNMLMRGTPTLTVARIAGTSVAKIDSNYGHAVPSAQRQAFA